MTNHIEYSVSYIYTHAHIYMYVYSGMGYSPAPAIYRGYILLTDPFLKITIYNIETSVNYILVFQFQFRL